jgi:hypothetical protein
MSSILASIPWDRVGRVAFMVIFWLAIVSIAATMMSYRDRETER